MNERSAGSNGTEGDCYMITELALERLAFTCRHCGQEWSADYDVARFEEPDGEVFEYFALDGHPVPSPYPPGAVLCPHCGQPATHSRLTARREIPAPPGEPGRPRTLVADADAMHEVRRQAPRLDAVRTGPPATVSG